jgi:uncharacterized protein yqeY
MNLFELKKEKMKAAKNNDLVRKNLLSVILGNIDNSGKLKKENADEKAIVSDALNAMFKQLKKAKDEFGNLDSSNQTSVTVDYIEQVNAELTIIQEYLPEQLSEAELELIIDKLISENNIDLSEKSSFGKLMRLLKETGASFDGSIASKLIKSKSN